VQVGPHLIRLAGRAITRDIVRQQTRVAHRLRRLDFLEDWMTANLWLRIHPVISLFKWLLPFNKSITKSSLPAGTAYATGS
jgi:hypothetical protein